MAATPSLGHTKIPHARLGMGSAALVAAVVLPRSGDPNFPQGVKQVLKRRGKKSEKKEKEKDNGKYENKV